MKIRIGNDFVFNWAIERGGLPEDLSSVLDAKLTASVFGKKQEVPFTVSGNIITIEFTPEICNIIGSYNLLFTYILPDTGLSDEDRKCAVDVDAFQIVAKTAQADDSTEFSMTSDMAIAFKGDKGDSAYQVWLDAGNIGTEEDYFNWLQKPATDAVSLIEDKIDELDTAIQQEEQRELAEGVRLSNEQSRVDAEGLRVSGEVARNTAEGIRVGNENTRSDNEGIRLLAEEDRVEAENIRVESETLRISAELLRKDAEVLRVEAETSREAAEGLRIDAEIVREQQEQDRQTNTAIAIDNAENATENANTAAQNANDARLAIEGDLALKANHGYSSNPKTLKQVDDSLVQLAGDTSVKMTNLVVNGGFEVGKPSWTGALPVLSEEEKLSGDSSGHVNVNEHVSYSIIDIDCNLNDRLYVSLARRFKSVPSAGGHRVAISNYGSLGGITNFDVFYKGNLNIWEVTSSIVNGRTGGVRLVAGFVLGSVAEYFVDNFITVNLTETFGKGSEPTKEEFELLLDILGTDYFEGEITIPAQKIMQWELALIRKNKNAIIALGGTII